VKSKPGTARGYFAIGIEGGSKAVNLGNLLRSAHAFGASFVFTIGADPRVMDTIADTSRAPSDLPLYHWQNIEEMRLPRGCRLVGIELVDDAVELPAFAHPVHAAYVLGPERGVLSPALIARCAHLVRIPTALSLNVATAGAIVMYDRLRCLGRFASRPVAVGGAPEARAEHVRGAPRRRTRGFDALSWPREDQICMLPSLTTNRDGEMRRAVRAASIITALSCTSAWADNPTLLEKYKEWSAFAASGTPKVCFALAQPKQSTPKGIKRGPVYFYISQWPADGVTYEVSVKMGYPFGPGAKATATVGGAKFDLFTKDEGAFVEKVDAELGLVEAMKKGSTLKIDGKSARGTATSDIYSLEGLSDALARIAKECSS
jgi:tRNA(Leu) C34 or U34 (ribose-2'-O)-methylase TrmL